MVKYNLIARLGNNGNNELVLNFSDIFESNMNLLYCQYSSTYRIHVFIIYGIIDNLILFNMPVHWIAKLSIISDLKIRLQAADNSIVI